MEKEGMFLFVTPGIVECVVHSCCAKDAVRKRVNGFRLFVSILPVVLYLKRKIAVILLRKKLGKARKLEHHHDRDCDCGATVFHVLSHEAIPVTFPFDSSLTTRDILHAAVKTTNNEILHLFVNHWSSRWGGQKESEPKRIYCAIALRKAVDNVMNSNPHAKIIIMGDFNDEPTNRSIFEMLLANNKRKNAGERELYNLMYDGHNQRNEGSYNYQGNWDMMDQIIVSRTVLTDKKGWHAGYGDGKILKADFMLYYDDGRKDYVPSRSYGGSDYYGGISDHLPVYFSLKNEK